MNTLVTKLKSRVDNDDLVPINNLRIKVLNSKIPLGIAVYSKSKPITITISSASSAYFTDSTGSQNLGKSITRAINQQSNIYIINPSDAEVGKYTNVFISDKYDIDSIRLVSSSFYDINYMLDSSDFIYTNLKDLLCASTAMKSLHTVLNNNTGITTWSFEYITLDEDFNINDCSYNNELLTFQISEKRNSPGKVYGDVTALTTLKSLLYIAVGDTHITGEFDPILRAWSNEGSIQTVSIRGNGIVTLNGTPLGATTTKVSLDGQGGYTIV